ncbi:MAG: hypothetical protein R6U20_06350 [Longimonas sp.]
MMLCSALVLGCVLVAGCADDALTPIEEGSSQTELREQVRYTLDAGPHQGAVPDSISLNAEVLMQSLDSARTLVTVAFEDTLDTPQIYPVHIHANSVDTTGSIRQGLGAIDNAARRMGRSVHLVDQPLDSLRALDAHINIHEQAMPLDTVLAQGNIGSNASAQSSLFQLERATEPDTVTYSLTPAANGRPEAPNGLSGTIRFEALTPQTTLVEVRRAADAPVTNQAHPVHLCRNPASAGGDIAFYLGALDGHPDGARSSWAVVPRPFDELAAFDGHVRVAWSNEALDTVLGQGDIGANAP